MKNSQKGFVVPLLLAIIVVLVVGGGVYVYKSKKAEAPVLPDTTQQSNQVQQTNIQSSIPTQSNINSKQGIVINQPVINQEVQLPIIVKGYLDGKDWSAFEGVAGNVQVFDANNKAISEVALLHATTDWMQPVVYFETTVGDRQMMSNLTTLTGFLVFKSDEAKDESNIKEFRLPIKFANNQTSNWKTYTNTQFGFSVQYPSSYVTLNGSSLFDYQFYYPNAKPFSPIVTFSGKENYIDSASFSVFVDNSPDNLSHCLKDYNSNPLAQTKSINGNTFYIASDHQGDAAMGGVRGQTSEYRIIHNNYCYVFNSEFNYHIVGYAGYTNTGVFDATPTQTQAQQGAITRNSEFLDKILSSFKFTK